MGGVNALFGSAKAFWRVLTDGIVNSAFIVRLFNGAKIRLYFENQKINEINFISFYLFNEFDYPNHTILLKWFAAMQLFIFFKGAEHRTIKSH